MLRAVNPPVVADDRVTFHLHSSAVAFDRAVPVGVPRPPGAVSAIIAPRGISIGLNAGLLTLGVQIKHLAFQEKQLKGSWNSTLWPGVTDVTWGVIVQVLWQLYYPKWELRNRRYPAGSLLPLLRPFDL